jgi:L-ascorbate metabolism protein UlaG (beta-lactamase superfamily)
MKLYLTIILLASVLVVALCFLAHFPAFGTHPGGDRKSRVLSSPNYRCGEFKNQSPTPVMADSNNKFNAFKDMLLHKNKRAIPSIAIPSVKTNLHQLPRSHDLVVWLGHSSFFMQLNGTRILIDPVLSGHASPFWFAVKSFDGSDIYTVDDLPSIDYLLITHDHYDHLDYHTTRALRGKVGKVITGLGTGAHLEGWGYNPADITELDWWDSLEPRAQLRITATPARHFSGRLFKRNQTLWVAFVIESAGCSIFVSGDTGYDHHFTDIGARKGPFDLAIVECGQYNQHWRYIHQMPEHAVQAAIDLGARVFMTSHWGKFNLSLHSWDEPIARVTTVASQRGVAQVMPMIGEAFSPTSPPRPATNWWETGGK